MVTALGGIGIEFGTDDLVRAYPDGQPISQFWFPIAIDNDGNILARCGPPECRDGNTYYELRVSEPGTLALLLPMIAGLALWPLRRRVRCRLSAYRSPALVVRTIASGRLVRPGSRSRPRPGFMLTVTSPLVIGGTSVTNSVYQPV